MAYCLVTVGTTEFRDLIKSIQHQKFINLLINAGIEKLCVQYGTGTVSNEIKQVETNRFISHPKLIKTAD